MLNNQLQAINKKKKKNKEFLLVLHGQLTTTPTGALRAVSQFIFGGQLKVPLKTGRLSTASLGYGLHKLSFLQVDRVKNVMQDCSNS